MSSCRATNAKERKSGVVGYPNCTTCTNQVPCSRKTRMWMFPLCESCWNSCGSPKDELTFYRAFSQSVIRLFDTIQLGMAEFLKAVQSNPQLLRDAINTLPPDQQKPARELLDKITA